MSARRGKGLGFTLSELMVTITVLIILAFIAVPNYNSFVANQRIKTASFDVMSAMVLARSEALKRNTNVTVTPTTGSDWASGWSVTAGATTLNQQAAFRNLTITGPASLSYTSNGRLPPGTAAASISISSTGATPRCISIDPSGQPNSKKEAC